jgi:iron uptake system component EfeO
MNLRKSLFFVLFALAPAVFVTQGCQVTVVAPPSTLRDTLTTSMQSAVTAELDEFIASAKALQAAAPKPAGRGWDKAQDAAAIEASRTAWARARSSYERIEGVIAPLFGEFDESMDQRYDYFVSQYGKDDNLFDEKNVTGMHAIERILWSDVTSDGVRGFESGLKKGADSVYVASKFPQTEAESTAYREQLVGKLISDAEKLRAEWKAAKLDVNGAFDGLVALVNEQGEKVDLASAFSEESRYSKRTMADLRDNMVGTRRIFALFKPLLASKTSTDATKDGPRIAAAIESGFAKIDAAYAAVDGPSIPAPPATWSAENPSALDLDTPFGKLYTQVRAQTDAAKPDSAAKQLDYAAELLK